MAAFWNIPLVVLSVLVAMIGSFTALTHAERMRLSVGRAVRMWMLAGAVTLGLAIWSMHFIGMLAWQLSVPMSYDIGLTLLSVVPAIATALLGFYVLSAPTIGAMRIAGASVLMGAGVSMMHYTGMAAVAMYPAIGYRMPVVVLSILIAVVAAAGALLMMYRGERIGLPPLPRFCLGGVVMGLAISGMHYTAMSAVEIHPSDVGSLAAAKIEPIVLAIMVSLISMLWFVVGILATLFDQRTARQSTRALERLRQAHEELHARARQMADEMMRELHDKDEQVQLLLESVAEAICGVDRQGRCTFVNTPCLELLGYRREELLGQPIHALIHHTHRDGSPYPVEDGYLHRAYALNERGHANEELFWRRDGGFFPAECWSHPICHDGQVVGAVVTFFDVTQRKAAETARQEALDRLQKIASQLPGVVFQLRMAPHGGFSIPYISDAAHTLYRLSPAVIRENAEWVFGLVHPEDIAAFRDSIAASARDLTPWHHEYRLQFEDGSVCWLLGNALVQREDDGAVLWHGFITDIGERKRMEESLLNAKRVAEEAALAKSSFLANMSHEIRTPMNAIIGLSYLALKTGLSRRQFDYVSKIHKAGNALLGIVNDILDFSKIDTGKLELESTDFFFRDVLERAFSMVEHEAENKGLKLAYDISADIPSWLVGDSLRLGQVLTNLLNNAVKFTESGGIELHAELLEQTSEQLKLRFSVSDSGIGMTFEQMQRLFQPFSQADGSTSRRYGGTGLGLCIAKRLVEMMHGQIWAESEIGCGSCFIFTAWFGLSARRLEAAEMREPKVASAPHRYGLNGVRILLAEDDEINRQIAVELLNGVGAVVDVARNGREAVEKISAGPDYDVVLMDIQMPEMDGYEATEIIRADPALSRIPILAMTAHALAEERERSLLVGMNDHISKPIEPERLFQTLEYWVKAKPCHLERHSVAQAPIAVDLPPIAGLDVEAALRRVTGNQALLKNLLQQFCAEQVDAAQRIAAALAANDLAAAQRIAHAVKGVAGNIGAITMQEAAAQLERALKEGAASSVVRNCLDRFDATMSALIDSAKAATDALETSSASAPAVLFDAEAFEMAVEQLRVYLAENNSKAIACFDEAHELFKVACNDNDYFKLEQAVYAFEFDTALALLNRIAPV